MKRLLLAAAVLTSCRGYFRPELPELETDLQRVVVTEEGRTMLDMVFPTDLAVLPDGGVGVLDSYAEKVIVLDDDLKVVREVPGPAWGNLVRGALADEPGVWWSVSPEDAFVLKLDADGHILSTFGTGNFRDEVDVHPVAVADIGDEIVVGTREGELLWLDADDGTLIRRLRTDVDGARLGSIADIAVADDGDLWVVDTFGPRVHEVTAAGEPVSFFGYRGFWVGYLAKPKAIAVGPADSLLVADSTQGAVEVFDEDGTALGVLSTGTEPLRLSHPMSLELDAEGFLWLLDARTAEVHKLRITGEAVEAARERAKVRHLRTPLNQQADLSSKTGEVCLQCHDGVINDHRYVWDPNLVNHPMGTMRELTAPPGLPLDDDGTIRCGTCHSPHGSSTLAEVRGAKGSAVMRHASPEGELFTRMSRSDNSLCLACHEGTAHVDVMGNTNLFGGGHPVGEELEEALAERAETEDGPTSGGCLGCHAVHGALDERLLRTGSDGVFCYACHADKADPTRNHPRGKALVRAAARAGVTRLEDTVGACAACHDLTRSSEALLRPGPNGGPVCLNCHPQQQLRAGHQGIGHEYAVSCSTCHQVHDHPVERKMLVNTAAMTAGDPHGCRGCHDAASDPRPGGPGHPVGGENINCGSCHQPHAPLAMQSCGDCHSDQGLAFRRGGHGTAQCQDCHPAHHARTIEGPTDQNPANAQCLTCHAPGTSAGASKLVSWSHPSLVFEEGGTRWTPVGSLPLYTSDGDPVPSGTNGELTCGSCHWVHGPDARTGGDKLRRDDWKEACTSCHGDNALVLYRYFHYPRRREGVLP